MKLSEMIRQLELYPEKVFISRKFGNMKARRLGKGGDIVFEYEDNKYIVTSVSPQRDDWEEVKNAVTWQEALESWINGKDIYVEYEDSTYRYENGFLSDTNGWSPTRNELELGKWFIK